MKIGLLTFHWAANHGAVLQSYATVKYIANTTSHKIEIIDYCPKNHEITVKNALRLNRPSVMWERLKVVRKEKKISSFRKKLPLSKRYYSNRQLMEETLEYDMLICGSDQIWNPSYLLNGEGRGVLTPVYFLNFGRESCKKVALSVSFGCVQYPPAAVEKIKRHIRSFSAISVRENTGLDILRGIGCTSAVLTADPTALLSGEEYKLLCEGHVVSEKPYLAVSILRSQKRNVKRIIQDTISCFGNLECKSIADLSVEDWLAGIRDAQVVVTNSFHCVMICLKLHTPFYVVTERQGNIGMNDRFYTLLARFDLCSRIIGCESVVDVERMNCCIDWNEIDRRMEAYADTLRRYLDKQFD